MRYILLTAFILLTLGAARADDGCCVCADGRCLEGIAKVDYCQQLCGERGLTAESFNVNGTCWKGGCKQVKDRIKGTPRKRGGD